MDRLNISLDTLRPERFTQITRMGTLEQAIEGLAAAQQAGFTNLKINTVLIGGFNDDEILDFVGLTKLHPWEVRFIELMPMVPVQTGTSAVSCQTLPFSSAARNCGLFRHKVWPDDIAFQGPKVPWA